MNRFLLAAAVVAMLPTSALAQHGLTDGGPYDAAVPTPASVLGYELGERFTPHHLIVRYAEAVATASPRVRLDTVAYSHEGREVLLATVTSEANQARLEEIRRAARGWRIRGARRRGAGAAGGHHAHHRLARLHGPRERGIGGGGGAGRAVPAGGGRRTRRRA
jgi:hypothetical protein